MRTLFIICTAVTLLQIFDVSIKGVLSAGEKVDPLKSKGNPTKPIGNTGKTGPGTGNERKPRLGAGNERKTGNGQPNPSEDPKITKPDPLVPGPEKSDPGTNPNDDDSTEAESPKTIKESGKKVIKTLKKMATNRGVGLLNGVTGFLKKSGGFINFFGNFLRDRSSKVKDVAKQSLGLVGSFSDSSTRGASHLLNSGKTIATQGGKELYSTLQKATRLGTNVTKLGGTLAGTPISFAEDIVGTANQLAKIPSRLSKTVTNGAIRPVLGYFGTDSDEQPEDEDGENADGENPDGEDPEPDA